MIARGARRGEGKGDGVIRWFSAISPIYTGVVGEKKHWGGGEVKRKHRPPRQEKIRQELGRSWA